MAREPIPGPDAKRRVSHLVDDLARYVDYLHEEGITEVDRSLAITPESPPASAIPQESSPVPVISPVPSVSDADVSAELKAIAQKVAACKRCGLHKTRCQAVPGQGNIHPDILFIGEGPGEDEDKQGLAFVGRAGQMLTRLITRMGYTRNEVFIANIVKCRPPNNRKPLPDEMATCFPYLKAQITMLNPKVIVALGAAAVETLVSPLAQISRTRGIWQTFGDIPLMPTYHPSYLFHNPAAMWDVWNDMQQVLARLGRTPPPAPAKRQMIR